MLRLLLLSALWPCALSQFFYFDNTTRQLKDPHGRSTLLHGVNVVYKVPPYYPPNSTFDPDNSLNDDDVSFLSAMGVNFVRLYVAWPGLEPQRGVWDDSYLDHLERAVCALGARGVVVLLDAHQDLLSPSFCGEGVPDFVLDPNAKKFPLPAFPPLALGPDGLPTRAACLNNTFFKYYFADGVAKTFQRLYDNADGVQDDFAEFWRRVALRFASNPHVLGYEVLLTVGHADAQAS
jgi:endoglycosylceramidase